MTTPRLAELRENVLARLEAARPDGSPLRLDLSEVTELDLGGLQLLFSVKSWAWARGAALSIKASSVVTEFASQFGAVLDDAPSSADGEA